MADGKKKRPTVLIATPMYPPRKGGSSTYFSTLVDLLKGQVDFIVYTTKVPGLPKHVKEDGVDIYRIQPWMIDSSKPLRYSVLPAVTFEQLTSIKLKHGRYLIHAHSNGAYGYTISRFSQVFGLPMLKEVQDTSDPDYNLKAGNVKKWIATGRFVRERLEGFGIPKGKILMYPSLNPPAIKDIKAKVGRTCKRPRDKVRILFVGWLFNRIKGVDVLVKAFKAAYKKDKGLELVVIGDGPDRPMLEALAKGLPVRFLGEQPYEKVIYWMGCSHITALASHEEANPRVIIEGYEMGLPAIATDVGGVSEEVIDGMTGILVPPNDPKAMAEAISRLAGDSKLRQRMAEGAIEHVSNLPTWQDLADDIYKEYIKCWNVK